MLEEGFSHRKAKLEGKIGDHFDNLYDENEDRAGQKIDEATGKQINNSRAVEGADERLAIIRAKGKSEDALGALPTEEDGAAKWLREHGGDQYKEAA